MMFFDKLLVRIRGELLSLQEDLSAEEDLRGRAELLLRKLEERVRGTEENSADRRAESQSTGRVREKGTSWEDLPADLRQEWEELLRKREEKKVTPVDDAVPPNPRQLG